MIKRDLLITLDDPFGEPAMKLLTLEEEGTVLVELLGINKNKFDINELQDALREIKAFDRSNPNTTVARYYMPPGALLTTAPILFSLDQECNEINADFTKVGKEG